MMKVKKTKLAVCQQPKHEKQKLIFNKSDIYNGFEEDEGI